MESPDRAGPDDVILPAAQAASVAEAFSKAWKLWIALGCVPLLLVLAALYRKLAQTTPGSELSARNWFIAACITIIVVVPLSFFLRRGYFKNYYDGKAVPPRHYLTGMLIVWSAAVLGGIVSALGMLISNQPIPGILPALVAIVFYFTQYPDGRAMTNPTGDTDDPTIYSEPR
jgi:hypothetical protein